MKTDRPINLSLSPTKFRFPLAALASITHRITGVLLFVGIAFLLYLLDQSLTSAQGLDASRALLTQPLPKLLLIAIVATLIYHFVAGIKHLFLDFDIGDTIEGGKLAAQLTIGISIVLIALAGAWLW
jgi:succinate dehydrogenase / fumarate reductase cytochrome b subunit